MTERGLTAAEILEYLPHRPPFRFVDEVLEVGESHAVSRYRFREDESFYAGHFPSFKVTPGVILLEAMSQGGAAVLGLHLLSLVVDRGAIRDYDTIMTDCELELSRPVFPGDEIVCRAEKLMWRHGKLRAKVELRGADGQPSALAVIGGMSVPRRRA